MTDHTPTPWIVRPERHDDWGWIRGSDGELACIARRHDRKDDDKHRIDKTDPYQVNADFIVKAVNNHDALVKALTDTLCELTACANQLAARGLKGHPEDSVSRAQAAARAALALARG
jgi:hypothetical protein